MNATSETGTTLIETLRGAVAASNVAALIELYAEDAHVRVVDRNHPPSSPLDFHGKDAITTYLHDIYSRDMTHRIDQEVVGEDRLAFAEACQYADGTRVLCMAHLELRDGKIIRQVGVQAWDE
jgi:ketosteroid isomerase-like protein